MHKKAHDFYAPTAINMIFNNLKNSYDNPEDLNFRNKMLKASYLAGVSMNNEMVGYAHAFAHQLGALYHIPHGNAIAMTLVRVCSFSKKAPQKNWQSLPFTVDFLKRVRVNKEVPIYLLKKWMSLSHL